MLLWGLFEIHSLLWEGPQFEGQISREGRCFVGECARVNKMELGAGEEERTAEEQVFSAGNELENG